MRKLKIALVEPFLTGSHQKWTEGFKHHSSHQIDIYGLPGKFWKWRMHGAAITLSNLIKEGKKTYDIIIVSDYIDLALFKSLLHVNHTQYYIYFHENQLTYPWSPTDQDVQLERDNHYAFINYSSALVADGVLFNSLFHQNSFIGALPSFLKQFPDFNNKSTIDVIRSKSYVLPLAIDLPPLDTNIKKIPNAILWNHRWEYDKNPNLFFQILKKIKESRISFTLIVLGESTTHYPEIFDWARTYFANEIIHWGYAESKQEYWSWLQKASILPVTSIQDFFGISIIEAMYTNTVPILPNRLVYPEHIPVDMQQRYLYQTEDELLYKIKQELTKYKPDDNIAQWINNYDWSNSIAHYDRMMNELNN